MTNGEARIVAALANRGYIGVVVYDGGARGWRVSYAATRALLLSGHAQVYGAPTVAAAVAEAGKLPPCSDDADTAHGAAAGRAGGAAGGGAMTAAAQTTGGAMDTDRNTAKLPAKEQLEVRLPLPPYALSPNSRTHWGTRARLIAQCRGEAKWRALEALGYEYNLVPLFPAGTVVRITAGAYRPKGRQRMDDDNFKATCKAYLDGFTDAGVWADDRQARWGEVTWGIEEVWGGRAEGGVLLTLTAEED